jgi:glycerophosphoryl diester phosphodiesterase
VLNIAHRGASGRFPENTLRAFAAAIDVEADMCELDVRLTSDGALAVIHDDTVERTTNGRGAVNSLTLEALKRLDAGVKFGPEFAGERVPALEEVFDLAAGRCGLDIELKAAGVEARVCELIQARRAESWAQASSFDWDALARIRHMAPEIRIGLLASRWPARLLGAATEMKADAINPRFDIVTEDLCIAAHKRAINVYVWTVDDEPAMRRLIAYGVDGIMTNFPERLARVMEWR